MEHGRVAEAARLWSDKAAAGAFASQLNSHAPVEVGSLGPTEGAAGSIYTTIPVVFVDDTHHGPADVVLRRVNDVPGSSETERRWHIERIDSKDAD